MIPSCLTDDELIRCYGDLFRENPATAELVKRLALEGESTSAKVIDLRSYLTAANEEIVQLQSDLACAVKAKEALAVALDDFLDDTSAANARAARKVLDGLR